MSEAKKIKVGLIGYGYWGPNLMRNLVGNSKFEVLGLIDQSKEAQEKCLGLYPFLRAFDDLEKFLKEEKPDAMVIATPPATHAKLAKICLEHDTHILVEKPLTLDVASSEGVLELAKKKGKTVMVDHTFLYNPAVNCLAGQVISGNLGELLYFDSTRVNLGGFQPQTNVLWDLAPHDLSILDVVTGGKLPHTVSASGVKHFDSDVETMCYAILHYENNFLAHLYLNWGAPVKVRKITVGGNKKMVEYDDNLPLEKIKIYDKGVNLNQFKHSFRADYRMGDMLAPAIPVKEPLAAMVNEFAESILEGRKPLTDGDAGLRVVKMLESLSKSMDQGGQPVKLDQLKVVKKAA